VETVQYVPVSAKALERLREIARENNCTLSEAVERASVFNNDYLVRFVGKLLHQQLLKYGVDQPHLPE